MGVCNNSFTQQEPFKIQDNPEGATACGELAIWTW